MEMRTLSSVGSPAPISKKFDRVKSVMFYVYILKSISDGKLYAGYTSDLRKRFEYHNQGKVESTKRRGPFKLIYYEVYLHQQDATTREKFFKTQWGRNYLRRVLKNYLERDGHLAQFGKSDRFTCDRSLVRVQQWPQFKRKVSGSSPTVSTRVSRGAGSRSA